MTGELVVNRLRWSPLESMDAGQWCRVRLHSKMQVSRTRCRRANQEVRLLRELREKWYQQPGRVALYSSAAWEATAPIHNNALISRLLLAAFPRVFRTLQTGYGHLQIEVTVSFPLNLFSWSSNAMNYGLLQRFNCLVKIAHKFQTILYYFLGFSSRNLPKFDPNHAINRHYQYQK